VALCRPGFAWNRRLGQLNIGDYFNGVKGKFKKRNALLNWGRQETGRLWKINEIVCKELPSSWSPLLHVNVQNHDRTIAPKELMVPLKYWLLRLSRRLTPQPVINFMLDRGIFLKPGSETNRPQDSAVRYVERVLSHGLSVCNSTVCVIGYGGSFGIGVYLLENGAERVILQDPYASAKSYRNRQIPPELMGRYFRRDGTQWIPDQTRLIQVHAPLPLYAERNQESIDFVFSRSVLEHVADVESLISASWQAMRPGGLAVHYINLKDHLPGYPFEMLCYSQKTWKRWLNASNNLNRLRLRDYESLFKKYFSSVTLTIQSLKLEEFNQMWSRIRPEDDLSG